jgi:UDP-glucose:(heptosyl)LPS alpha-1,3-glucosyltransferase
MGWTNHARARGFARAVTGARRSGEFDAILSFEKLRDADAYYAADICFVSRRRGWRAWLPRNRAYARLEADCFAPEGPDILFLCRKQEREYRHEYALDNDRALVLPPMIHDPARQDFYERRAAVRRQFGIPETAILAVSVGVYPKQKGMDRTIAALRDVPELEFLAVGLKDIAPTSAQAEAEGVLQRSHLFGHSDSVGNILDAADLLLHPARVENTGLVIVESLLAGVPVIASAACGFAEYVERFAAGIVLPEPFDPAQYVSAIRLALNPNTLTDLKSHARESASRIRADGGLDRILDVIESVLRRRRDKSLSTHGG